MKARKLLLALLLTAPLTTLAGGDGMDEPQQSGSAIYKTVGPDGQVVFSDKPLPGEKTEKVELAPTNVQPIALPRPLPTRKLSPRDRSQSRDGDGYAGPVDIRIVSPQDGATIPPGQRFIALQVAVTPEYPEGAQFYAVIDGQPWRGGSSGDSLDISALERGSHSVQAALVGAGGEVLARSQVITIYVKRPGGTVPDIAAPRAKQAPKAPVAPGLPQAQPQQQQRRR